MKIVPVYDRSDLIHRAIDNLKSTLIEVILTVVIVVFIFLWHPPSAIIPAITIPIAVLVAFIPFRMMGVTANIMSLGGHRHRRRRAGGCGHCGGRAGAQGPGTMGT